MQVTLYSKKNCSACTNAKKLLRDSGIPFNEMMLDEDFTRDFIVNRFPGATTYPVVILDGFNIGGYQELKEHVNETAGDTRKLLNEGN